MSWHNAFKTYNAGIPPEQNPNRVLNDIHRLNLTHFFDVYSITVQTRLSESLIIRTWDAKENGQSTHCDHVIGLRTRSTPALRSCHARTSYCTTVKSSSNAQRSKRNAREVFYQSRMRFKSSYIRWSILWVWLGHGQCYPNFLLIRTVWDFPLAKGVQIIVAQIQTRWPTLNRICWVTPQCILTIKHMCCNTVVLITFSDTRTNGVKVAM